MELFIALRNKVEHRFEDALKAAAGGRAHALVINFEQELVAQFSVEQSLADRLRFPLFVESITAPERRTPSRLRARSEPRRPSSRSSTPTWTLRSSMISVTTTVCGSFRCLALSPEPSGD